MTIPESVRDLLLVKAGDQADFVGSDIRELRGMLKRDRPRSVSVREMNAAILRHHARNR